MPLAKQSSALWDWAISNHFPDTDPRYKNISSSFFVEEARKLLLTYGYSIANLDVTIYAERPLLKAHVPKMRGNLAGLLGIESERVNLKATRGEGLGFIGHGKGIGAECVVLIYKEEIIKKYYSAFRRDAYERTCRASSLE